MMSQSASTIATTGPTAMIRLSVRMVSTPGKGSLVDFTDAKFNVTGKYSIVSFAEATFATSDRCAIVFTHKTGHQTKCPVSVKLSSASCKNATLIVFGRRSVCGPITRLQLCRRGVIGN
ncbi:hypothetical protein MHPYR_470064 [uncultured Mycobacterium sp.]|uniref:Uncharacterized protein n=1 Tax=uncultured Mycobacterium sp. TaxID=171292 RepID=A0A1Y5PJY6_9MYCO|nr:hypothetical protein MHPYR_470064 [uncultured Mycobacterium sp.]